MTFPDKPVRKIEIKVFGSASFVDITSYVLKESTLNLTVGSKISGGRMIFDNTILNVLPTLTSHDEIKVTVGEVTADTHIFTGLLRDSVDDNKDETLVYNIKSFAILPSDRDATEIYREDAATGDPVEVFRDLVDKYLSELNYDIGSIPNKEAGIEDFKNHRLQNTSLKEEFDFIAGYLGRVWYVDKDKKIFLISQEFTDSGFTLTAGSNVIGSISIATDLKRWANYVSVDGKKLPVGWEKKFNGTGAQTVFELDLIPNDLTMTVDGDVQDGAIEGTDFSDDADYLVDKEGKKVTFQAGSIPGADTDNVIASGTLHSKVHDEFQDSGSIARYTKRNKLLIDESIDTNEKAKDIAQNYLGLYSEPLKIFSGKAFWNDNILPLNKIRLIDNTGNRSIDIKLNVIESKLVFGNKSFELRFKLNDFDFTTIDLYEDLVNRVKRLEFNERSSGNQIAKYLFFGANFVIALDNLTIFEEGLGNAFCFDVAANSELDDNTLFLDGNDGSGSLIDQGYIRVINADNLWTELFNTDWFEDTPGAGSPNWNTATKEWTFVNNDIGRTKLIFNNNVAYSAATLMAEGTDLGNLTFKISAEGGSNKEEVTNETRHVFTDKDTSGTMVEVEASGNATITKLKVRGEE